MKINGVQRRTIWLEPDGWSVGVLDQTQLPFQIQSRNLRSVGDVAAAIRTMVVRGAPLIGVTAAYGMALAMKSGQSDQAVAEAAATLLATRPTAVNLRWALDRMTELLSLRPPGERLVSAYAEAARIADDDVDVCRAIGRHGVTLIRELAACNPGRPVNILTHCNAGWLATVDWGTATAPIYAAHQAGIPVHVWVDETRPRNQGALLTAFELGQQGVPHTVIADNAGGHLMQRGQVDMVIVGTDRVTAAGDVANKIGTYLKALAARDCQVPFWVALPASTIDWSLSDGLSDIPIEQRSAEEVTQITGRTLAGELATVRIVADGSPAANPAFDVTPARLITGLITERGCCEASVNGLAGLFPDHVERRCPPVPAEPRPVAANEA
jgi:methylthioribose-1-phosphate isomerase